MSVEKLTQGTVLFDTSGVTPPASVTLAGAVNSSQTNFTLSAGGASVVDGTYIRVLAETSNTMEIVRVVSGGGTANPTVSRGEKGTAPSAHSNGATVDLPGHITHTLQEIAAGPNRKRVLAKISPDIHFVAVLTAGSDSFPGGGTLLVLADESPDRGTAVLIAPEGSTTWILLAGAGASGSAGSGSAPTSLELSYAGAAGAVGTAFSGTLVAVGGVTPYTFSIASGSLPPGLSLSASTGRISGTPTQGGSYTFTAQVTDVVATTATVSVTITISAAAAFTLGTPTYVWEQHDGGWECVVSLPVTPPSPLAPTIGVHIFVEAPDQSAGTTSRMDGSTDMSGAFDMSGLWTPLDLGKFRYVASEQPFKFVLAGVSQSADTAIRIYAAAYSADQEAALVRHGVGGETPNVTLTIGHRGPQKPASGSNITPYQVCGVTASAAAAVSVGGKLRRPISVTVDVSCLTAATVGTRWGYQLLGFVDGDTASAAIVASGVFDLSYPTNPVPAGPDGIDDPHTFGPEEPTQPTTIVIYAVAGLITPQNRPNGQRIPGAAAWTANNIVPGITPSCTVTIGTMTGTIDLGASIAQTLQEGAIASQAVSTRTVRDAAITATQIVNATITGVKIAAATITGTNIAAATIAGSNIAASTVAGSNIAASTVAGSNIAASTVTGSNIAASTVTGANIDAATITGANIASLTISAVNIANLTINGAKITNNTLTDGKMQSQTLTAASIANGTITATQIANATITSTQIANATITGSNIANGTITATQIANATITATQIANGTITATQIANLTITATQIANLTITGSQIANATIGNAKITDLDVSKLNAGTITVASTTTPAITVLKSGGSTQTILMPQGLKVLDASGNLAATLFAGSVGDLRLYDGGTLKAWLSTLGPDGLLALYDSFGTQQIVMAADSGVMQVNNLPSVSPGAGSKKFWYDPSAGNVVKFAA